MTDIKPGRKYRVTFEGTGKRVEPGRAGLMTSPDSAGKRYFLGPELCHVMSVEEIEEIEPGYEPFEMYVDADADFFRYWPSRDPERPWFEPGRARGWVFDFPTRPLRKLVTEAAS